MPDGDQSRELKELRAALARETDNARRLRALADSAREGILTIDAEGIVVYANPAAGELVGYAADELIGGSLTAIMPESERARFLDAVRSYFAGGRRTISWTAYENIAVHKSGRRIACEVSFGEYREGGLKEVTGFVRDISGRHAAEERLRLSEARYRSLVQATTAIVWTTDAEGRYVEPQPGWERYTGQSWEEHQGLGWAEAIHPRDRDELRRRWARALEAKTLYEADGEIFHAASSGYRRFEVRGAPVFAEDGSVREWIGAVVDVHERWHLDARVRETQKMESLGLLAGGIAHDYNNILVGVLGNAGLALRATPRESPLWDTLSGIETAAMRAAELTKQLLAYAGKATRVSARLDLNALVQETLRLIEASIAKNVVTRVDLADDPVFVEGDAAQLRQVVMNLILNASEAIEGGSGIVTIRTRETRIDADHVRSATLGAQLPPAVYALVEVADTGRGMDDEARKNIFDPFFTTKSGGRGLGLAAVQGILRGHRGAIDVYSVPTHGTTMKVLLPSAGPGAAAPAPPPADAATLSRSGTVLIADDEAPVREVCRRILASDELAVVTAPDGDAALDVFRARHEEIELVLLDLNMPGPGAGALMDEMRKIRPSVQFLLMSGYNQSDIVQQLPGKWPGVFLQKPFGPRELIAKLHELFKT